MTLGLMAIVFLGPAAFVFQDPLQQDSQTERIVEGPSLHFDNRDIDRSTKAGLAWLARHQNEDGRWGAQSFTKECTEETCLGQGDPLLDIAMTALALHAFHKAGHDFGQGSFKIAIRKGLIWLMSTQGTSIHGLYGERANPFVELNHALGSLAMSEGHRATYFRALSSATKRGLRFQESTRRSLKIRGPHPPPIGERESYHLLADGWITEALVSAHDAGIDIEEKTLKALETSLDTITNKSNGKVEGERRNEQVTWPQETNETLTAIGLAIRSRLSEHRGQPATGPPWIEMGVARLLRCLPEWREDHVDFAYWYFGSLSLTNVKGEGWETWKNATTKALITNQKKSGDCKGSWDPDDDPWGRLGGRVYSTALGVLCLELCRS